MQWPSLWVRAVASALLCAAAGRFHFPPCTLLKLMIPLTSSHGPACPLALPCLQSRLAVAPPKFVARLAAHTSEVAVRMLQLKQLFPEVRNRARVGWIGWISRAREHAGAPCSFHSFVGGHLDALRPACRA